MTQATEDAGQGAEAGPSGTDAGARRVRRSFFAWSAATYLLTTAVVVAIGVIRNDGHLVYVIDDPAIHLSVAGTLVEHGTWGVVPGHFQSASSSPLWTLLLAAWLAVVPGPDSVAPLVLNLVAGLGVIAVFSATQTVFRPGRRRLLDVASVAVVVNVLLFLPGLAMTGMEHSLHIALLLASVALFHRRLLGRATPGPAWLPYGLLALASLARFETLFVALGLGAAFLLVRFADALEGPEASQSAGSAEGSDAPQGTGAGNGTGAPHTAVTGTTTTDPAADPATAAGTGALRPTDLLRPASLVPALRHPTLVVACAAVPVAAYGVVNKLMGQGWLPNSVSAKADPGGSLSPAILGAALTRFGSDPLVAGLAGVALAALLVVPRRSRAWAFPAVVLVVSAALHMLFARVGWYERYQAYLIALGLYMALHLAADHLPERRARPSLPSRQVALAGLVGVTLLFSGNKPAGVIRAPEGTTETYEQRYQAALFLSRYYQGEHVATGELGYVSLFHDGPLTDLLGLGDHDVLQAWLGAETVPQAGYWHGLAEERGFDVVAIYPLTLYLEVPEEWIPVGTWDIDRDFTTSPDNRFQFYATRPEAVARLHDNLDDFADDLPPAVHTQLNPLAEFRAGQLMALAEATGGEGTGRDDAGRVEGETG